MMQSEPETEPQLFGPVKFRHSHAAYAIEATAKTLRNWLQRGQVDLSDDVAKGEWREFTVRDIAQLALVRRLTGFGIDIPRANIIAKHILAAEPDPCTIVLNHWIEEEANAPSSRWINWRNSLLLLWTPDGNAWKFSYVDRRDAETSRNALGLGGADPVLAYISIDVVAVLDRALTRAALSLHTLDRGGEGDNGAPIGAASSQTKKRRVGKSKPAATDREA